MILADTSVWIDHLRRPEAKMSALLNRRMVLGHPFVLGELACGSNTNRAKLLHSLRKLPQAVPAHDDEVLDMIENHALMGIGIGFLDAHLLASANLTQNARFWTHDKRLAAAATRLGIAAWNALP